MALCGRAKNDWQPQLLAGGRTTMPSTQTWLWQARKGAVEGLEKGFRNANFILPKRRSPCEVSSTFTGPSSTRRSSNSYLLCLFPCIRHFPP